MMPQNLPGHPKLKTGYPGTNLAYLSTFSENLFLTDKFCPFRRSLLANWAKKAFDKNLWEPN